MKYRMLYLLAGLMLTLGCEAKVFKALTLNIRIDIPGDSLNTWEVRRPHVARFLAKTAPSVFGLQEVLPNQFEYLAKELAKDYDTINVPREDGKLIGESNPIFYRKKDYKLIKSGTFWLSDTPDRPSTGWDASWRRICTWAVLQNVKTGNSFLFANTHLDNDGERARMSSSLLIKERLARMANNMPIVLVGDFNIAEGQPVYHVLTTRLFPLADAHRVAKKAVGTGTFHQFGRIPADERIRMDFIFLPHGIDVKRSVIHDGRLGRGRYLSDHEAYYVEVDGKLF